MKKLIKISSVLIIASMSVLAVSCDKDRNDTRNEVVSDTSAVAGPAADAKSDSSEATARWLTVFDEARAESKRSGKPIFAMFTGSDWCGWCIALHAEVLEKKEFLKYAAAELVLFEADFPRKKKISDELKKQNQALSSKYGVRGFPTVLILDVEGNQIAQTGYQDGGAAKYVEHIKSLVNAAK